MNLVRGTAFIQASWVGNASTIRAPTAMSRKGKDRKALSVTGSQKNSEERRKRGATDRSDVKHFKASLLGWA